MEIKLVDKIVGVIRERISKGKYSNFYLTIPTLLAKDSTFPFNTFEKVLIIIDHQNNRVVIEKLKNKETDS